MKLKFVYNFLTDSNARNIVDNLALVQSRKRVAVACINHAFKVLGAFYEKPETKQLKLKYFPIPCLYQLVNILNLEWDSEGRQCLDTFRVIRDTLSEELSIVVAQAYLLQEYVARQPFPSHEIIIAEVKHLVISGGMLTSTLFIYFACACSIIINCGVCVYVAATFAFMAVSR